MYCNTFNVIYKCTTIYKAYLLQTCINLQVIYKSTTICYWVGPKAREKGPIFENDLFRSTLRLGVLNIELQSDLTVSGCKR